MKIKNLLALLMFALVISGCASKSGEYTRDVKPEARL